MEFILSHEHPLQRSPGMWESWPQTVDRVAVRARLIAEFSQAREHGVVAMVDVTTMDLGREPALVQDAAQAAGMRVLHATGIWLDIPMVLAPRWGPPPAGVDDLAPLFVHDIREGIAGTGIRAEVIKLASTIDLVDESGRLTPRVERIFRAGAVAAKETGTPITTHTDAQRLTGMSQVAVFEAEGVDPAQVVIGHSTRGEVPYLLELLERGYALSMDNFARVEGAALQEYVDRIADLCRRGWSHRIMLGHDHAAYNGFSFTQPASELSLWCRIPREVAPALERAGVAPNDLENLCHRTARTVFRL